MTGLLVSVRDAREALAALAGGADVIDVKEPRRGSLGAADSDVVAAVTRVVAERAPVSVATGELRDDSALELATRLPPGLRWAKVGLAGCGAQTDWPRRWRTWRQGLPAPIEPVVVLYADAAAAGSPPPADVVHWAVDEQIATLLVDTFDKSSGALRDYLGAADLQQALHAFAAPGRRLVLAGSLRADDLAAVLPWRPSLVAVRGAVCRHDRTGELSRELVEQFKLRLASETSLAQRGLNRADTGRDSADNVTAT